MRYGLFALAAISIWSAPAAAGVYACHGSTFCKCTATEGCNGLSQYLGEDQAEICREGEWTFEATVERRKVSLKGETINAALMEVRPYFNDFDWYQTGATANRGVINLNFDNESDRTEFELQQMTLGSTNDRDWILSGKCEVID